MFCCYFLTLINPKIPAKSGAIIPIQAPTPQAIDKVSRLGIINMIEVITITIPATNIIIEPNLVRSSVSLPLRPIIFIIAPIMNATPPINATIKAIPAIVLAQALKALSARAKRSV